MSDADKALADTLDLSAYESVTEVVQAGVSYYGARLSLESETAFEVFFYFDNEDDVNTLEITVDGEPVVPVKNGDVYGIKIKDIPAHEIQNMYTFKIGDLTMTYGIYSYGHKAMITTNEKLKNTIKALYAYNQAPIKYRK